MTDLVVDTEAAAAAAAGLRAVAAEVGALAADQPLARVASAVPGGLLAEASDGEAAAWTRQQAELAQQALEIAAGVVTVAEALVGVDRTLAPR